MDFIDFDPPINPQCDGEGDEGYAPMATSCGKGGAGNSAVQPRLFRNVMLGAARLTFTICPSARTRPPADAETRGSPVMMPISHGRPEFELENVRVTLWPAQRDA